MEAWLCAAKLDKYVDRSLEEEYDDVSLISTMTEGDIKDWANAVDMKAGAIAKLKKAWRAEQGDPLPRVPRVFCMFPPWLFCPHTP